MSIHEEFAELIQSRTVSLGILEEDERIDDFFARLSAEMAGEMRIQRGYEPDADESRKKSEYIEKFKCDIVLLAFEDYVAQHKLLYICDLNKDTVQPATPHCDIAQSLAQISASKNKNEHGELWQHTLYFLLHLVPVDMVSTLLHQCHKWEILATKTPASEGMKEATQIEKLLAVLALYLNTHDAQFKEELTLSESALAPLKMLFENPSDFNVMFPKQMEDDPQHDAHIPIRGLREMMRFGHHAPLMPIFKQHKITKADITHYNAGKEAIAGHQQSRELLHNKSDSMY